MPDSHESTLPSHSRKTTAAADGPSGVSRDVDTDRDVAEAQKALCAVAADLLAVDQRLSTLVEQLPVPGSPAAPARSRGARRRETNRFVILAELRGAVDCVRADLLADAIMTLEAAGTMTEDELRRQCAERRRVLVL